MNYLKKKRLRDTKKPFMCISYNTTRGRTKTFFSGAEDDEHILVADVIDASSAAPVYYPPKCIDDNWFIDGGAVSNNPVMTAICNALVIYGKDADIRVVSIGTGVKSKQINGNPEKENNWGIVKWMKNGLLDLLGDPTPGCEQAQILLGNKFVRVTGFTHDAHANDSIDDFSHTNLEALTRMGNLWWEERGAQVLELITKGIIDK